MGKVKDIKGQKKLVGVYKACIDAMKRTYLWKINPDLDYKELNLMASTNVLLKSKKSDKDTRKDWYKMSTVKNKRYDMANRHVIDGIQKKINTLTAAR